jgi:hypothetical protein
METIPTFLDFEASSLGSASYPIEVAWNRADGSIESYLITPASIPKWTDWNPAAEQLHGITRAHLLAVGHAPAWVCKRMNEQLAGQTVYSDDPDFDGMWLAELFAVSWGNVPSFTLAKVGPLLLDMIGLEQSARTSGLVTLEALKAEARKQVSPRHRAGWDVQYLVELWRLARRGGRNEGRACTIKKAR